jgi:hypothetical protein
MEHHTFVSSTQSHLDHALLYRKIAREGILLAFLIVTTTISIRTLSVIRILAISCTCRFNKKKTINLPLKPQISYNERFLALAVKKNQPILTTEYEVSKIR